MCVLQDGGSPPPPFSALNVAVIPARPVPGVAEGPGAQARLNSSGFAPLAQLAEHFHGKEGVYGSSP